MIFGNTSTMHDLKISASLKKVISYSSNYNGDIYPLLTVDLNNFQLSLFISRSVNFFNIFKNSSAMY